MKITIMAIGTLGDVEPFIVLAEGLIKNGHTVNIATGVDFEASVRERNVAYNPIRFNYKEVLNTSDSKAAVAGDQEAKKRLDRDVFKPSKMRILEDIWLSAQGTETIICNSLLFHSYYIAEKLNIPLIVATCSPFLSPTASFPFMYLTTKNLGGFLNKLSYLLIRKTTMEDYPFIKQWCKETLKIKPGPSFKNYLCRNGRPLPMLYHFSPLLFPKPDDWHEDTFMSGYWYSAHNKDWEPSSELVDFLSKGTTPIYIGFGSMITSHQEHISRLVISALQKVGERAIICSGDGGIVDVGMPESVYYTDFIPFDWLFPRVKAVVHHGGLGTTSLGLKYGKPTVICPVIPDQAFWGKVVYELGVSPPPFPRLYTGLTSDLLADALKIVTTDESMRRRADKLGENIRQEDGFGNAIKFINKQIDNWYKNKEGVFL
ncbi:MAG: glycosyltransferase family 1 protein [Planctomycetes bacterium]|nr:glycosyltransferase family 1 protein [Planctomycetota bacterium]